MMVNRYEFELRSHELWHKILNSFIKALPWIKRCILSQISMNPSFWGHNPIWANHNCHNLVTMFRNRSKPDKHVSATVFLVVLTCLTCSTRHVNVPMSWLVLIEPQPPIPQSSNTSCALFTSQQIIYGDSIEDLEFRPAHCMGWEAAALKSGTNNNTITLCALKASSKMHQQTDVEERKELDSKNRRVCRC